MSEHQVQRCLGGRGREGHQVAVGSPDSKSCVDDPPCPCQRRDGVGPLLGRQAPEWGVRSSDFVLVVGGEPVNLSNGCPSSSSTGVESPDGAPPPMHRIVCDRYQVGRRLGSSIWKAPPNRFVSGLRLSATVTSGSIRTNTTPRSWSTLQSR